MSARRAVLALLLLAGCPRHPPQTPQDGLTAAPDGDVAPPRGRAPTQVPAPDDPDAPDTLDDPDDPEPPARPSLAAPGGGEPLADTLRREHAPARRRGGCEGGVRRAGESWRVDCNACSCGDDGQVTCTAMACAPRPAP